MDGAVDGGATWAVLVDRLAAFALLAGTLLRERPDRIQRVGVGACLVGVLMLSA
jgi:uncharacterized membrane protein